MILYKDGHGVKQPQKVDMPLNKYAQIEKCVEFIHFMAFFFFFL